jgi:hypothetical protein
MKKLIIFTVLSILMLLTAGCDVKIPDITVPDITFPPDTPSVTTPSGTSTTTTTSSPTTTTKPTASATTTAALPAQVSGIVYYREPSASFPADAAPAAFALEGAAVSVSGYNVNTTAYGEFTIPAGVGCQTITVEKDGYIPTQVSWDFASGQSYVFNIGLYKAPAAVNARPGFVTGVITWDAGGWLIDYYYNRGLFPPTYANISANGGNMVTVSDPVFIKEADANHVVMSTVSIEGSFWRMMNEAEYTALVTDAHSKGLDFMLWLGMFDEGRTGYYQIVYADGIRSASFWDDWFAEYEKYAVESAVMAEKLGMEYINLGHDMGYAAGASRYSSPADSLARWQKLISAIRSVYSGKLAYFAGVVPDIYFEPEDFAPGFVELFDAVGLNVQNINSAFNPSLDELKDSITTLLDRCTSWQRPVFIMVRTPSVDGGTSFDTYIEPLLVVNREADKHVMNVWQQADIYEAFYEVVNGRPAGNGQVMGIFCWGYNYLEDYLKVPGKSDGDMAMDKSGNTRGKPAEAVMKFWDFGE